MILGLRKVLRIKNLKYSSSLPLISVLFNSPDMKNKAASLSAAQVRHWTKMLFLGTFLSYYVTLNTFG